MSHERTDQPPVDAQDLRTAFHALIRRFGLLETSRTPCGQPLAVTHAHALMELLHRAGLRQGDLAGSLGLSKSAVSRMVDQLERRGWLERRKDTKDGRVRLLSLTTQGRRLAQNIDQASLERFSTVLAGIPPATRAQVVSVLEVLLRAVPLPVGHESARDRLWLHQELFAGMNRNVGKATAAMLFIPAPTAEC